MLGLSAPSRLLPASRRARSSCRSSERSRRACCARFIHKFDVADLKGPPPPVQGRFYVFVDECHRTQGGDMNKQMKRWLEGAVLTSTSTTNCTTTTCFRP